MSGHSRNRLRGVDMRNECITWRQYDGVGGTSWMSWGDDPACAVTLYSNDPRYEKAVALVSLFDPIQDWTEEARVRVYFIPEDVTQTIVTTCDKGEDHE